VGAKIFQSLETKNDFALNDFARIPDIGKPKRIFSNPRNRSAFIRDHLRLKFPSSRIFSVFGVFRGEKSSKPWKPLLHFERARRSRSTLLAFIARPLAVHFSKLRSSLISSAQMAGSGVSRISGMPLNRSSAIRNLKQSMPMNPLPRLS